MGEKILAVGDQEGAEASLGRISRRQHASLEQPREILLHQVARVFSAMPLAANEDKQRIPVRTAQRSQCFPGPWRVEITRLGHATPVGAGKLLAGGRGSLIIGHGNSPFVPCLLCR